MVNRASRSPWLEILAMVGTVVLAYVALTLIVRGAEPPPSGMPLVRIALLSFGFFLLSLVIAIVAIMSGVGGGVLFTPLMLSFTPVDSLIIRGTGLIVAMFAGLTASGPFMKSGLGNLKLSIWSCAGYGLGAFIGAQGALWVNQRMGETGEGVLRMLLGALVFLLAGYFLRGGVTREWPEVGRVDRLSARLRVSQPYYEPSLGRVVNYRVTRVAVGFLALYGVGMISGFFGLGAGWAVVPTLNLIMGIPLKVAAAASVTLIGMGDCIAIWPYLHAGAIIPLFVAPWLVGMVLGGIIGARIVIRMKAGLVRMILIGILIFAGFGLVVRGLTTLGYIGGISGAAHVLVLISIMATTTLCLSGSFGLQRHKR